MAQLPERIHDPAVDGPVLPPVPEEAYGPDARPLPPARGQFCHAHFSWLCQAGQGKCQRGEEPA